jgi:hypothetical protein
MNFPLSVAGLVLAGSVAATAAGADLVAAPPPEAPTLVVGRDPQAIVLQWTGNGRLETASGVRGPWTAVAGSASPHRLPPAGSAAFFRLRQAHALVVTRAGSGTGSVRSSPEGVACGNDCAESYPAGSTVTLQAVPDAGSVFAGWGGDCGGTGDCLVEMDRPRAVTASFAPAPAGNPVVNGDFEQGPGVGWAQFPGPVIFPAGNLGGAPPYSGSHAAFLGFDRDDRRLVQLGQRVQLPDRRPLFLNFAAWVYSEELCDVPWYDQITLYLDGEVVFRDDRVCRGSGTDGWLRYSVDLGARAGRSVALVFEVSSADVLASVLLLDDIAVADRAWGE